MHGEETGTKAWEAWEAYANVLARPVDLPSSTYLTHLSSVSTFIHSHGAIHASATRLCPGLLNYRGCVHLCVRMIAAVIRRAKVEIVTIDRILSKLCVFLSRLRQDGYDLVMICVGSGNRPCTGVLVCVVGFPGWLIIRSNGPFVLSSRNAPLNQITKKRQAS